MAMAAGEVDGDEQRAGSEMQSSEAADPADGDRPADPDQSRWERARERYDDAREHASTVAERVVAARPETPLIDAGFELYERDSRIAGWMLAGAVAFRLFLLVVPVMLIIVSGLGFLHKSQAERATTREFGLSETLVSTMATVGENAVRGRWITLLIGLGAAVLAIRTLIKSLRVVHNLAWGTDRKAAANRPIELLAGLGVVMVVLVYFVAAQWLRANTPAGGFLASGVTGLGAALVWLLIERLLPRAEGSPWSVLVPGAILVGVLTQVLYAVTVFYFAGRVNRMSETYGPLGIAIVALLWLYLLARIMVASAVVNAVVWERRERGVAIWSPVDMALFRRR